MKIELLDGERLVKHGFANLQRGAEAVGGKLFLTDQRLVFNSHSINVQTGEAAIPLPAIKGIELCWTKFLNVIPLMPNSLVVSTAEQDYRFVLFWRKSWQTAIEGELKTAR